MKSLCALAAGSFVLTNVGIFLGWRERIVYLTLIARICTRKTLSKPRATAVTTSSLSSGMETG